MVNSIGVLLILSRIGMESGVMIDVIWLILVVYFVLVLWSEVG